MEIEVGDLVQIFGEVTGYDHIGKVVTIDDHPELPIEVEMPKKARYLFGAFWQPKGGNTLWYHPDNLRSLKDMPEVSIEDEAFDLFKCTAWQFYMLKAPLDTETSCMGRLCKAKATTYALVNVWGVVYQQYVCRNCRTKLHGKLRDEID